MEKIMEGFTFLALAYNHEKYIIEHLESIKFLIEAYSPSAPCKLIINDDLSKDRTVEFIEEWLKNNDRLFYSVVRLYNEYNVGTCKSVTNMMAHLDTTYFKLTACDDVYSFENIFEYMVLEDDVSFLSGYPIALIDDQLSIDKRDIYSIVVSDSIYNKRPISDRFKLLSNNNAPNIIYNHRHFTDERVLNFINNFDVIEDWPAQIAISKNFPSSKFKQVNKVFVYYRRTIGSTYLVASNRFHSDKLKIYESLIDAETSVFIKLIIKSRYVCFKSNNKLMNKFFNLGFYLFLSMAFFNILKILRKFNNIDLVIKKHIIHHGLIKSHSKLFFNSKKNSNGG